MDEYNAPRNERVAIAAILALCLVCLSLLSFSAHAASPSLPGLESYPRPAQVVQIQRGLEVFSSSFRLGARRQTLIQ